MKIAARIASLVAALLGLQPRAAVAEDSATSINLEDTLKSGQLIRLGFTAGVGVAVLTPYSFGSKTKLNEAGVAPLPYVAVLPARWGIQGAITKAYCASRWLIEDAQTTADRLAYSQATDLLRRRQATCDAAKTTDPKAICHAVPEERSGYGTFSAAPKRSDAPKSVDDFAKSPESFPWTVYDAVGWVPHVPGRCGLAWVPGVYVGVPGDFTADAKAAGTHSTVGHEMKSLVSAGMALAPVGVASLLIGVTLSRLVVEGGRTQLTPSLTFAIGGNLDLAGLIIK